MTIDIVTDSKPKSGFSALPLKKFFGLKEGQTLREFSAELKSLTTEDRRQLQTGIEDGTLTY